MTHIHADHYGLAGRIQQLARSHLVLHRLERAFIDSRFAYPHLLVEEMNHFLHAHGVPDDEARRFAESSLPLMERVHVAHPDRVVDGGETLHVGGAHYQVIWTPGDTAGHTACSAPSKRFCWPATTSWSASRPTSVPTSRHSGRRSPTTSTHSTWWRI